jgi:hypothetical protein
VPITRLDKLGIFEPVIALIKIDVEGYEMFVMLGAKTILLRTNCVYFESWESHYLKYGCTCNDILRLLSESGFQTFKMHGNNEIVPVTTDYISVQCENLIALKDPQKFLARTGFRICTP